MSSRRLPQPQASKPSHKKNVKRNAHAVDIRPGFGIMNSLKRVHFFRHRARLAATHTEACSMLRRTFLGVLAATSACGPTAWASSEDSRTRALRAAIIECEGDSGGRLGVCVLNTGSGQRFEWRSGERFAMCSTFKFLLAAAVLRECDAGRQALARRLPISQADIVSHSPMNGERVGVGATVGELCQATMTLSDNGAANLLLALIGGPPALTRFARAIGDRQTRLDRWETALNSALAGDPRDTTTPGAMVGNLQQLLLGRVLAPDSREQLTAWMRANQTGDARLRAGLPAGWVVGDKTGSGANGTTNDIAILWPPGRSPLLVAAYLTASTLDAAGRDGVHRRVAQALSG
jgi:beta-lactamase class A